MIDGIARGAGDVGHDVAFLADEGVDERRLSGVGASDDRELGDVLLGGSLVVAFRHILHDLVEEVACARTVGARHLHRVAEAELIEFGGIEAGVAHVFLVGHHNHRLLRAAENLGHLVVEVGDAGGAVDHEEDHVGLLDGDRHLLVDLLLEHVVGIDHPAAGVDDREFLAVPVNFAILAVARGAGRVVDNRAAGLRQAVEKRGFSHVRPPYYCYELAHILICYLSIYPNSRSLFSRLRQSFSTLTKSSRYTFFPKSFSISVRAWMPTFLILAPPLPMMIPFCESRST